MSLPQPSTPSSSQPPARKKRSMDRGIPLPGLRWRGFTLQMFLFIVLPLIVLLLVITFGSLALHHDTMRSLVGDRDLRTVRAAAASLSREIDQRGSTLRLLANEVVETSETWDTPTMLAEGRSYGFEGGLALLDASGQVIRGDIPSLPNFTASLPALEGSENAAPAFSEPLKAADSTYWVLVVVPTQSGQRLVGAFSPAALARPALTGITAPQSALVLVSASGDRLYQIGELPHSGSLLTYPGVTEVLRGESGVNYLTVNANGTPNGGANDGDANNGEHSHSPIQMFDPRGLFSASDSEHVAAFSPVAPLGWGLVMEEPWEETASPLLNATQAGPLILVPVLILALLALWFGARQIVQPLQTLETQAVRFTEGDPNALREPAGGISEIRNLQEALADMAGALQSAQEALHSYIGALTDGVETERRSLARELHDDTLQALIALNQNVQLAQLRTSDPQQRQQLGDLQTRINETIANLRRAIGGLRPIYLEDLGLVAALGMLARNAPTGGPEVSFHLTGSERRLPPETELAFYRITQEALNNAIHHAKASHVWIELAFAAQTAPDGAAPVCAASLTIRDDGVGFNLPDEPGAFAHHGHYGLLGMHERAELTGARLEIDSMPGRGTSVMVTTVLPAVRAAQASPSDDPSSASDL